MDAIIVRMINLPYSIKGLTIKDSEGDYNIYLNARLSANIQADAFRHEINHIKMGHFYIESDINIKELEAG